MIISVSRRCDIPAFSGDRFMKELHGGETVVRSPFRPGPGRRVSLKREDVDAFIFWSRDPRPFMGHLPGIDRGGYPYYFLITLTGYPCVLEPAVPAVDDALPFFRELATRLGRRRVVWRYDPVIFTPATPPAFHAENFSRLAFLLAPYASRAIVSFFDPYPKALRRLRQAGIDGLQAAGSVARQRDFLARCAAVASASGMEIQSCAEPELGAGITPGKCVDEGLLNEIFGLSLSYRKDPSQRKLCRCSQSVDIGSYGACRHGCLYCYAR